MKEEDLVIVYSKDILNVVIVPCTVKKSEINRLDVSDTDFVLTTRELALLLKEEGIDLISLGKVVV